MERFALSEFSWGDHAPNFMRIPFDNRGLEHIDTEFVICLKDNSLLPLTVNTNSPTAGPFKKGAMIIFNEYGDVFYDDEDLFKQ